MLKRKLLLKRLWYILYCAIILIISAVFGKFLNMLFFILFFEIIQGCFYMRFHSDTIIKNDNIKAVKWCKLITVVVEIIYLIFCKEFDFSVYGNILEIFGVCSISAFIQFYFENLIIKKEIKYYNLDELKRLCDKAKLTEIATQRMIWKYIENKTYDEISSIEKVEVETIKQSIRRSRRKIESLNNRN